MQYYLFICYVRIPIKLKSTIKFKDYIGNIKFVQFPGISSYTIRFCLFKCLKINKSKIKSFDFLKHKINQFFIWPRIRINGNAKNKGNRYI